jgi:RNA polymerase sigma-70 factor (ECF subfamily)
MHADHTHPNGSDWLAQQFEAFRPHLQGVAYRMLGSVSESEDAVQEVWIRLGRTNAAIDNLGGWLTTVVGRVCVDMLRARAARREDYVGSWLPEPVVTVDEAGTPEQETLMADAVGLALLVVLDTLSPAERLAFVLHDMFALPFDEIAPIIDRSPAAARQLASRARRTVQGATPDTDADLNGQRAVVDAFLRASRTGDFDALVAVLHPDVVFRVDAGAGAARGARPPVVGAEAVAQQVISRGSRFAGFAHPALVNGDAGVVVGDPARPFAVVSFTVLGGRITAINLVTDPDKLPRG